MRAEVMPKTEWIVYNDEHVNSEPKNWEGIIQTQLEYRIYPTILFYEKLDPEKNFLGFSC